jgi:hypothetical protein
MIARTRKLIHLVIHLVLVAEHLGMFQWLLADTTFRHTLVVLSSNT